MQEMKAILPAFIITVDSSLLLWLSNGVDLLSLASTDISDRATHLIRMRLSKRETTSFSQLKIP